VLPDAELFIKAEVAAEVLKLKAERDAVILGHNYMEPALFHTVPDFQGDSLELSRRAAETTSRSSCSAESASWRRRPRS